MERKVLVVGGLGVVGRTYLNHLEKRGGWKMVALSRRAPDFETAAEFRSVDLRDLEDCRAKLSDLSDITHMVYTANYEKPNLIAGWTDPEHVEVNLAMLRNIMSVVEPLARSLKHVTLMQGAKAYGAAAGPYKIPAKESDARYLAPNFYYVQEDYLRGLQQGKSWTWTALRPQVVIGHATASAMNGITAIGTFAAISRELGMPLRFPGGAPRVNEATDARLLAKAIEWAGQEPRCAGEAFNIVNGDVFTWEAVWPRIAKLFGMEVGPAAAVSLNRVMVDKAAVWERVVKRYGLQPYSLDELTPNWQFADSMFGYGSRPNPSHLSTIKARKYGFQECQDSEEMLLDWLTLLQEQRILPPA
ncbi:MAG: SDR family oxidoreductase [Kiloniellales bacterium]